MTQETPDPKDCKARTGAGNSRDARLKAALKANMARRKAQARAREDSVGRAATDDAGDRTE